jgi:hypothetical protein
MCGSNFGLAYKVGCRRSESHQSVLNKTEQSTMNCLTLLWVVVIIGAAAAADAAGR